MKVLISGTTGYLGSSLKTLFQQKNWKIRELRRGGSSNFSTGEEIVPFKLGQEPAAGTFSGFDVFIHCAYDFSLGGWEEIKKINIDGSLKCLEAARLSNVRRIIFISSLSAFDNCLSLYGQAKLSVEKEAVKMGAFVLRPGLIYGPQSSGIFGNLVNLVRRSPFIPLVGGGEVPLYLVRLEDLGQLILKIAEGQIQNPGKPVAVANPAPISLKGILRQIAQSLGKKRIFFPVPYNLVFLALKLGESAGLGQRLRSDSLVGLFNPVKDPDFSWVGRSGVGLRNLNLEEILPHS